MGTSIMNERLLHKGWLTVTQTTIRLTDGTEFKREIEHHGRGVAVLPYDGERRTAVLVKLLRAPPLLTGVADEMIEAPAGLMEEAEEAEPEQTARREVMEETGLRLESLEHVATAWTMPGISTETMTLYLSPYSQASRVQPGGGLAVEHENITVMELPLQDLWSMVQDGRISDMKTLLLVYALRQRHPELFA